MDKNKLIALLIVATTFLFGYGMHNTSRLQKIAFQASSHATECQITLRALAPDYRNEVSP